MFQILGFRLGARGSNERKDIKMKIIAIEEHWNSPGIRDALDHLPAGARDESVAFNTMGDNQARLEDIGQGRVEAMDASGNAEALFRLA
jgi:hypothetical protein